MCIGLPMFVTEVLPGHAVCCGRGQVQRVDTALVGEPAVGDWLLVFLGSARERIAAQRAAEVNAVLDMLEAAMRASGGGVAVEAGFTLPSTLDATALAALTGSAPPRPPHPSPLPSHLSTEH
jgi:hydrogenase expression/formation protein HypC